MYGIFFIKSKVEYVVFCQFCIKIYKKLDSYNFVKEIFFQKKKKNSIAFLDCILQNGYLHS